ncbi:hypothetical protein SDC9_133091 [bioreactor metagenome]|uniref:Uncharacterized protein n=1 Tax=bioreactor metagenome TaxID=1076179 RepID=A0A645DAB5_9ZZZZ
MSRRGPWTRKLVALRRDRCCDTFGQATRTTSFRLRGDGRRSPWSGRDGLAGGGRVGGDRAAERDEEDDQPGGDEHVADACDAGDHLGRLLTEHGEAAVPDQHAGSEHHSGVVEPEEPVEQLRAARDREDLLEDEHDQQHDEAEDEQVRVGEAELGELPFGESVELGELAIEQAGGDADEHVDEGRVEQLLHVSDSFRG